MNEEDLQYEKYKSSVKCVNSELTRAQQASSPKVEIIALLKAIEGSAAIVDFLAVSSKNALQEGAKYAESTKHCAKRIELLLLESEK